MHANAAVQAAAKAVLAELAADIRADSTEASIAAAARGMLAARGYPGTWYHGCPALVLLGDRSCLSISGRAYRPADEPVGQFNLVTVDLSPCDGALWGDCARSYCVRGWRRRSESARCRELLAMGLRMQLHAFTKRFERWRAQPRRLTMCAPWQQPSPPGMRAYEKSRLPPELGSHDRRDS